MKETRFIAQNKEKWREAETLLNADDNNPEKLSNLFIQVVDDLSYSRTYYPNRSVRVYLNKIARQFFAIIYSHKTAKHSQFRLFWLDELPQIIIYSKRQLLISLLVFLMAFLIGVFSTINDPQFATTILGADYVTMTEHNIKEGDPMAVYKQMGQVDMFLGITLNNLMVAFRTYVLGIFLGIGTLASLIHNGIMVGSFQYYFIKHGLFLESSLSIWLHGTLEISSIILAGGAGLTLSTGLIFPGTYSRLRSLQLSGIRSLKLMLGIAPILIFAAIIESFLTRYTGAPDFLKISLIVLSAVFIVGYFVIYPWLKSRKGFEFPLKEIRLQANAMDPVDLKSIKNNAGILKDAFQFYFRHNTTILSLAFFVATGLSVATLFTEQEVFIFDEDNWWIGLVKDMFFALHTPTPIFILINGLGTSIIMYRVMKLIDCESKKLPFKVDMKQLIQISFISILIYAAIYLGPWGIFVLIVLVGYLTFVAYVQMTSDSGLLFAFSHSVDLFRKNDNQGITLQLFVALLSFSFLLVLSAPLLYIHLSVLKWNFVPDEQWSVTAIHFAETFIKIFSFYLILPVFIASFSYLYFSQEETGDALNLKEAISKMGTRPSKRA